MDAQLVVQSVVGGLFAGSIYGVAATGMALVFGVAKIANLAHGAFILVGMYVVYVVSGLIPIDPLLLGFAAIPVGLLVGWLVQRGLINRLMPRGADGPLLVTLGIWIALESVVTMIFGSTPHLVNSALSSVTFSVGEASFYWSRLAVLALAIAFTLGLQAVLRRTDLGRSIRAVSQDPVASRLMGLNVGAVLAAAMALGAAAALYAGALSSVVIPVSHVAATNLLLVSFVASVLGGLGNVTGAFVGGIAIGVVEGIGSLFLPGTMKVLVVFAAFILCLLLRPEGLGKRHA